jgi:hypothetical protein
MDYTTTNGTGALPYYRNLDLRPNFLSTCWIWVFKILVVNDLDPLKVAFSGANQSYFFAEWYRDCLLETF